jgi:hypothetical protein
MLVLKNRAKKAAAQAETQPVAAAPEPVPVAD